MDALHAPLKTELDADAAAVLKAAEGAPPIDTITPETARAGRIASIDRVRIPEEFVASVEDLTLRVPDAAPVRARLYRPIEGAGALPVLVYGHGGGWVLGNLDTHDDICRRLANRSHVAVLAVDYRLAPEHPYPAALDDFRAALSWVLEHGGEHDLNPDRVLVGGDSAGGTLAAAVALERPDDVAAQVLLYPPLDLTLSQPSQGEGWVGYPLSSAGMLHFSKLYLQGADPSDWRASPLFASNLDETPPTFILSAGHDPLRDDAFAFARRLDASSVRVKHVHAPEQMHGFLSMAAIIRRAPPMLDEIGDWIRATVSNSE